LKKTDLIKAIVASLTESLLNLERAARAAHAEATDESSKAENKYDTRGLEAAYLAGGQAKQVRELADSIKLYQALPVKAFPPGAVIDISALVEIETNGAKSLYFLGPRNGGLEINHKGREVCVITPQSPLGSMLMGRAGGASWTEKIGGASTKYRILNIW
jgi:hypothetical protein